MQTEISTRLAYGIDEAVQATSIGRSFLYQEIRAGNLKIFKIGSRTLIAADDLGAWLKSYQEASQFASIEAGRT